jgi:outer membrane immunogenic protein
VVYDWSGFYIGANGGWGSARNCWDLVAPAGTFIGAEGCHDATGGTAGGQVGYRWQAGTFVFGLEAQGNWADFKGSNGSLLPPAGLFTNETKIDAFGLFTGQVGYAWNNALLYVKGGAAVTANRFNQHLAPPGRWLQAAATKPTGVAWSAAASNTGSPRTGRPRSNTITSSCRTRPSPSRRFRAARSSATTGSPGR